ncbi:MAG: hypothetical protein NT069_06620 [Planctomycetota bacterium]|nr:hypothetical protein [Planctomycetota bacterium]
MERAWGDEKTAAAEQAGKTSPEPPLSPEVVAKLHAKLDREIQELTESLKRSPENVELYSQRGDRLFFRGKFAEAVADFDKMVELNPQLDNSHWRRGIAYFYAKQYERAAHQFEIYHSFDNIDRENGIWRYLSQVKAVGRDEARKGLLKYEKDDREPFPDVYKMFAGDRTGAEILEKIKSAELSANERTQRLFYAELYVGLNEAVEGRAESAEAHLREAVANTWGAKAGGGPGWMWQVGRVHYDLLRQAREKESKTGEKAPGK